MSKPCYILFYPAPWKGESRGRIPFALLYLERMTRDLGLDVILIDEQCTPNYIEIIEKNIERAIFAGVSSMTGYQIKGGIDFSRKIKAIKNIPVIWGGWHATLMPEQVLKEEFVDFVIAGQAEESFRQFVEALLKNQSPKAIAGLAFKNGAEIVKNPPNSFININKFPHVDLSLIDLSKYVFKPAYAQRCIGYFSSHGCPFNCGFCCVAEVYGKKWYRKDIKQIIEDLTYIKNIANIDSITFDDDNFFVNRSFTIDLCNALIESNLNLLWDTSAHAALFLKLFNDDDIKLLYKAGCRQIYIGAESGDEEMLKLIDKKANVEDNFRFVELLNKHQITPLFSTMVCFPVNPERDLQLTKDMIRQSKLIDKSLRVRIFFYTPYPGTELYKLALEKGFKEPESMEGWVNHTLRKFHAPWWTRDFRMELEIFANFYLPMANPMYYKLVPGKFKRIAFIINKIFYPMVIYRFKNNKFGFPIEAKVFLTLLRMFNKVFKQKISLGFESYLD